MPLQSQGAVRQRSSCNNTDMRSLLPPYSCFPLFCVTRGPWKGKWSHLTTMCDLDSLFHHCQGYCLTTESGSPALVSVVFANVIDSNGVLFIGLLWVEQRSLSTARKDSATFLYSRDTRSQPLDGMRIGGMS